MSALTDTVLATTLRATEQESQVEPPPDSVDLKQVGAFLRAHREHTTPAQVGLPAAGRRRTPGLRREEVAALSGVGLAWYSWIEQGRVSASRHVLEAISRTLGLDPASRRHLLALAGYHQPVSAAERRDVAVTPAMRTLLSAHGTSPAVLVDHRLDIVAWNAAYSAVWPDPGRTAPLRRNLMWTAVGDPVLRGIVADWDDYAKAILAHYRTQIAHHASDERVLELQRLLRADFPEFADWWSCQGVAPLTTREIALRAGTDDLRLSMTALRPVDDPGALLIVQTPVADADHELVEMLVRAASRSVRIAS
jgi:transcriptional regulator with XRE-family HTH domain